MLKHRPDLPLSPREQEILLLAADGLIDKEICNRLNITRSTISTYWTRLRDKLGAVSRAEAVAKALARAYQDSLEDLRESKLWMELFIEAAVDYAIFSTDGEGKIVNWNPGVARQLGYAEDEFVGQNIEMLFTPADREEGAPALERQVAMENGRSLDNRWHVRKDGIRIWCEGFLFALRDGTGDVRWFAKIMRDSTEVWQMRRELDALRTLHDKPQVDPTTPGHIRQN